MLEPQRVRFRSEVDRDDREISLVRAFLEARHAKGAVPAPSLIEIFVELTGIEPVTS
jgi:hypothetical protein